MKIADMNWMQVEAYLQQDDRCLLPIGCTEQHAYLSLAVDAILAERVAVEAAEPLGVPVFPVLPYGLTPAFMSYPGTVTLRLQTLLAVVTDLLDSLAHQGFRRILIVNGHGGNQPVAGAIAEWLAAHPQCRVRLHNWWNAPRTLAHVKALDPASAHASWMENLPWTRLPGVAQPDAPKPPVDYRRYAVLPPDAARALAGDGNFGGAYQRPDEDVLAMWRIAVEETRELIHGPWD
ncbi:MAG: creatininase [Roseateles depolymerans]|uniref:Creatininase n=1 Tax=Roseateles depolymerans TaxID=76731 RepID=A0A2W5DS02_9BURK|nr:MAG: creatininase [Roseateles depolymerans]